MEEEIYKKLLALPDATRQTYKAMLKLKIATATKVSEVTGRSRSTEVTQLGKLILMGYLRKRRSGHKIIYQLK